MYGHSSKTKKVKLVILTTITPDPGCAVDIPAALYSLSFYQPKRFSSVFPYRDEILEYMREVAHVFDVDRHIRCSTSWEGAEWNEKSSTWKVTLKDMKTGEIMEQHCKMLVSAIG